jgi:Tfp pilus assembly protein PilZ
VDVFTLGPKALTGFPGFDRYNVACGLTLRLLDPVGFKQKNTDLCGIVAFTADLARQKPVAFALLVAHLADKGRAQLDAWNIEPHISVRSVPAGHKSVAQVDWVCLASLRDTLNDADNLIFNVVRHWQLHPIEGVLRDDVFKLAQRSGYARVFSPGFGMTEPHLQHGGLFIPSSKTLSKEDAVLMAADLFQKGWTIILLADGALDKALQEVNKATGIASSMAQVSGQAAAQTMVQDAQQRATRQLAQQKPDSGHAMLVADLRVTRGQNPTVSLTVVNRGEQHTFQNIPLAAFCTHMSSYVAATNRAPDGIGPAAVIDALRTG